MTGLRLKISPALRCAYCHDALASVASTGCPRCQTLLHERCWAEAERCPTLGCRPPRGRRVVTIERAPRERRVFGLPLSSVLCGGLGALLFLASALVLPAFQKMFEETGMCQPVPTSFLMWIPEWAWWTASALSVALVCLKDRWVERWSRETVNGLCVASVFLLAAWIIHCLVLPTLTLIEHI